MKLHYSLMQCVIDTVYTIFAENKMADKAIQTMLKSNKKFGSRDRAFIAENTYEIVRWWRLLHYINGTNIDNCHPSTIWKLLGIRLRLIKWELPEIIEFKGISRNTVEKKLSEAKSIRKVYHSIPDWLDEMGKAEIKEEWDVLLPYLNDQAPVCIRVNTLKTNFKELKIRLSKEDIDIAPVPDVESAAFLAERTNIHATTAFKEGLFELQDPGSQLIGSYLQVKPGMRVIDACAGAGGKSLQLACIMENKGTIIALDTEEWKLEELKKRAKRNGIHNIDARPISGKTIKRLRESADAVLLDVPCSGLGVLRRNPDAKWKLSPDFINNIKKTQAEILNIYSLMVKPSGKLVYATCSILPSENEMQVQQFLEKNPNFKLISEKHVNPMNQGYDGFYMALIERVDK